MHISRYHFSCAALIVTLLVSNSAIVTAAASVPASAVVPVQRDAAEFMPRGGLPNVMAKLSKGEPVAISYLGGSITAQNGWRVFSRDWLQKKYPNAKITGIHAAIGGTGSDLGVFRVEKDALAAKPDLLFVEFAVNDASAPNDRIVKGMEGIVRKTWRLLPTTDICFVYTVTFRDSPDLGSGKMKRSTSMMEAVADYYGIPSINMGLEVARMEKAGKLIMKSDDAPVTRVSGDELNESAQLGTDAQGRIIFSKDGVHPYPETGHVLYMQALTRSFEKLPGVGAVGAHALIEPLSSDNWEAAVQFKLNEGPALTGPVTKLQSKDGGVAQQFAARMSPLWRLEPGASLSFKFKGTKVSIYDIIGPDGAMLEITVDGKSSRAARFDGYCTYHRLSTLSIADNMPDTVHEVSIKVLADKPDKAGILFDRNKADLEKSPAKYEPTLWYAGAIFIVGELVK
jgi:hypothetical protein